MIGDMRTAALIGLDGSIDWCCLPRFDSGSVFAGLLDSERGGTWAIHPEGRWTSTQHYLPRTNILETTFRTADGGIVTLTDFMPVAADGRPSGPHPEIHRRLRCTKGRATLNMIFMPRFEYGARTTRLELLRAGLFATDRTDQVLTLSSAKPFDWTVEQSTATTRFNLEKGEERWRCKVRSVEPDRPWPSGSTTPRKGSKRRQRFTSYRSATMPVWYAFTSSRCSATSRLSPSKNAIPSPIRMGRME